MRDAMIYDQALVDRPYADRITIPVWQEDNVELDNVWEYVDDPEPVTLDAEGYIRGWNLGHRRAALEPDSLLDRAAEHQHAVDKANESKRAAEAAARRAAAKARRDEKSRRLRQQRRIERIEERLVEVSLFIARYPKTQRERDELAALAEQRSRLEDLHDRLRTAYVSRCIVLADERRAPTLTERLERGSEWAAA
jgi:hypothetical protein